MPLKKRNAKAKPHRVTPEAVEAFRLGDHIGLHRALGLKPWHPNPLDVDDPEPPAWVGPTHAWAETWRIMAGLRADLEEAAQVGSA